MSNGCLFCDFAHSVDPAFIHNDEICYVIEDSNPVSEGHLLIIPKKHIEHWFEASMTVQNHLTEISSRMHRYLNRRYSPDGFNLGVNCGLAAGQSIMHLHVHLIPRYHGDVSDPLGGVRGVIPSKQCYTLESADQTLSS